MDRDSKYGLIAMGTLLVAGLGFGGYAYMSSQTIEASFASRYQNLVSAGVPLKTGWNDFTNGRWSIDENSAIIGINGSLMSIKDATERGIITEVATQNGKVVLGRDASSIEPKAQFSVNVSDTTNAPAMFIQNREQ